VAQDLSDKKKVKKPKVLAKPTLDIWESMGLDDYMRQTAVIKRKACCELMKENYERLIPHVNESTMPFWIVPKI
jgi:hypothetical protein